MRACWIALWIGVSALAFGCGSSGPSDRVIVLGIDGIDPDVVDLLLSEGELPNFARLRQGGAYGRFKSSKPLLSPIIWTTIATGKTPLEHGISHFVAVNEKTGAELPVTSQMRRVKALWNVLSEAEREVAVVGWWATWPAETVRGAVVSDHTCYHFLFDAGESGSRDTVGVTHPPDLLDVHTQAQRRAGQNGTRRARLIEADAQHHDGAQHLRPSFPESAEHCQPVGFVRVVVDVLGGYVGL